MPKYAGQFSVYAWDMHGAHHRKAAWVDMTTAIEVAHAVANTIGAKLGLTNRIIITNGGDETVFEWQHGQGVTYPPPEARARMQRPTAS